MGDVAVARILSARTHYDVLALESDSVAPPAVVRRQYKVLAIRVHPDKNRADGAADAFKRLSEAYECLVDERVQHAYRATLKLTRPTAPHRPRPPPPPPPPSHARAWPPTFPTKQHTTKKKKKKPPPPPTPAPPPVVETPKPKRWRTPEEIWAQFQREEEEQAKREFRQRGFDRDYDPLTPTQETDRRKRAAASSPPRRAEQDEDPVVLQGVEIRAQDWTAWKRSRSTAEPPVPPSPLSPASVCCLLCRRKFPTHAALARHEQLSTLHKENLAQKIEGAVSSGD